MGGSYKKGIIASSMGEGSVRHLPQSSCFLSLPGKCAASALMRGRPQVTQENSILGNALWHKLHKSSLVDEGRSQREQVAGKNLL